MCAAKTSFVLFLTLRANLNLLLLLISISTLPLIAVATGGTSWLPVRVAFASNAESANTAVGKASMATMSSTPR